MFLVSAMREEFVLSGDPKEAVVGGFKASSKVVTAAAMIMTSVFIAFIPGGSATIQPIAFGLAVGVAVDAFVVRMTFVPAVLTLLGRRAWWLPAGLDRVLPEVDVEGAALHRKVAYEAWEADAGPTAVYAKSLVASPGAPPLDVVAPLATVTRVSVPEGIDERWLAQVLTGRARPVSGELVVGGLLLPEQRERVNRAATVIDLADPASEDELSWWLQTSERLAGGSRTAQRERLDRTVTAVEELEHVIGPGSPHTLQAAVVRSAHAVTSGASILVVSGLDWLLLADDRYRSERLVEDLAARGLGVVLLLARAEATSEPDSPDESPDLALGPDIESADETRTVHD
jgi:RND superfamily putative drug exporter